MPAYISPAARNEAALPVKPISPKREFEQLIRSIRGIAAKTRAFSGELIHELMKETESSARGQRNWSWGGSAAQLILPAVAVLYGTRKNPDPAKFWDAVGQSYQMGSKIGDLAQSGCSSTQFSYQASAQRIQQALSHYNTFDQRMQSLMTSIDSVQQRLQQKEMEEASNR